MNHQAEKLLFSKIPRFFAAGIVTDLGPQRGQAMGLNVFTLFVGFGIGSLIFGAILSNGINIALAGFGTAALIAGLIAFAFFRSESHRSD